jgi:Zn-dependent protease
MMSVTPEKLYQLLILIVPLLFSLSFHEAAHAWMAKRRGDDTADLMGRLTLNPLAHIELFGTILLPALMLLAGGPLFGWAKPVPVNPAKLRNYRRDNLFISLAGPVSNLLLALLFAGLFHLLIAFNPALNSIEAHGVVVSEPLFMMLFYAVTLNLGLAFFNMLPLPALDGSHVMAGLLPERFAEKMDHYQSYSFIVFIILLSTGALRFLAIPVRYMTGILLGGIG